MPNLNFYLPHLYNENTQEFDIALYTNVADNVLMNLRDEDTVKDAIEKLKGDVSNKADLDQDGKIKIEQLPDLLDSEVNISDYISSRDDNELVIDEDGKLFVPLTEISQDRDFIQNPIDLAREVTGILLTDNIDVTSLLNMIGDFGLRDSVVVSETEPVNPKDGTIWINLL